MISTFFHIQSHSVKVLVKEGKKEIFPYLFLGEQAKIKLTKKKKSCHHQLKTDRIVFQKLIQHKRKKQILLS